MNFPTPLLKAILIKRYKRFLADVELADGSHLTVHCPNPGAMIGVKDPGSAVWISDSNNPKRKLRYTLELIELSDGTLVGLNTNRPNAICEEIIKSRTFPIFGQFETLRREVKYGENSRIDLLLEGSSIPKTYIEVKSITLQRTKGLHEFPDGVTERGRKHLVELGRVAQAGHRAIMLYLIQRQDGDQFALARDIDPQYGAAFDDAIAKGLEAFAIRCKITPTNITAEKLIPINEPGVKRPG